MELAYLLCGGSPVAKSFQVDATVSNVGVPLLIDTAGQAGLNAGTTTSAADLVGMTLDTVTYSTTQGVGANSAERKARVLVNPDAVWTARMSGGAAEGTALTLFDVTTADANGLNVITGDAFTNFDEGVIWGYDGANARQVRKITVGDGTDASVTIPFDNGINVGDNFMVAPYWFNATTAVQLTTNLFQADASIAVATGAEFAVIGMNLLDIGDEGRTKSSALIFGQDHVYSGRGT